MAAVGEEHVETIADNETTEATAPEYSPKKGPTTLSTSTSSYEPLETHDPNLNRLAVAMFDRVSEYLKSEMTSSENEYQLLEDMNKVTLAKYQDLTKIATNVGKGIVELNEKFKNLQGYLDQIDQIEDSICKLEHAAYKLDAYTVRLENKFKSLERQ